MMLLLPARWRWLFWQGLPRGSGQLLRRPAAPVPLHQKDFRSQVYASKRGCAWEDCILSLAQADHARMKQQHTTTYEQSSQRCRWQIATSDTMLVSFTCLCTGD